MNCDEVATELTLSNRRPAPEGDHGQVLEATAKDMVVQAIERDIARAPTAQHAGRTFSVYGTRFTPLSPCFMLKDIPVRAVC